MTFRSLRILFAFIFISSYSSFAQCDFTLDIKVIQNSSCISNGIIQVNLSGEDVDLTKVQITLTDGGSINMMATANNQQFTTLPKGTYSIVASTICKNSGVQVSATGSATITSSYVDMVSYIGSFRKSLNCAHTGMIPIHIVNGRAPYKIQVTNAPAPYSGATSFTLNSSSDIFTLDDLPPGNYDFKVTDDCGYEIPLSRNLGTVASDFPSNPYSSSLHLATPPATDCNKVSVMAEYVAEELEYYWNENRDKYYEAAFTVNGSPKNWVSLEKGMRQVISLPSTIKSMRDNHDIVDVHLRIKGCSTERQNADNIFVFSILDISFWYAEFSCSSFISYFYPHYYSENPAYDYSYLSLICYPYKWEVYHVNTNTVVYSKDNVMDGTAQELPQLSFNEEYEIVVTDKEGVQIRSPFKTGRELYGYWAPNYCLPNPFTSQIYLYWPGSYIPAGTRIKQVSGVTPAKHPDITLSNDISTFFPFSTSYEESEYVTIEDGKYEFEITNTCGDPPYILTFEVRNYELRGDAYTSKEGCSGLEVTPTRRLYIDIV